MRISGFPNSVYDTAPKKRRIVGLVLLAVLLTLFLVFNRVPKLDTVRADLAVAASPVAQCFQGFCIEAPPESSLVRLLPNVPQARVSGYDLRFPGRWHD